MGRRMRGPHAAVGILLVIALCIVVLVARMRITPKAAPDRAAVPQSATQAELSSSPERATVAQGEPLEELAPAVAPRVTEVEKNKAAMEADRQLTAARQEEYERREDEVFAEMPKYEDVRDQYRKIAEERLAGIAPDDTQAVMDLAQGEIEAFWNKSALLQPEAYEHGFLASAIMEIACERKPDDFAMLSGLKEALAAISPLSSVKDGIRWESYQRLWPVIEKQYKMVTSGQVPLSPEALAAVYDWKDAAPVASRDLKAGTPGWQWLVDHAEECGMAKMRRQFEKGLERSKQGLLQGDMLCVAVTPPEMDIVRSSEDRLKFTLIWAKYGRRIPSLKGSKEYQRFAIPAWEFKGKVTLTESKP